MHGGPNALWQWLCASILMSARIKSNAGKLEYGLFLVFNWLSSSSHFDFGFVFQVLVLARLLLRLA